MYKIVRECLTCPFRIFHEYDNDICRLLNQEIFEDDVLQNCPLKEDDYTIIYKEKCKIYKEKKSKFNIIGDVHGCFDELQELLVKLDFHRGGDRQLVFVGDLVDRGPKSKEVLEFVMDLVSTGDALCVMGNHDNKLMRWAKGNKVLLNHGLEDTVLELADMDKDKIINFISSLPYYLLLDSDKLAVVHASWHENIFNLKKSHLRSACLYGPTTGEDHSGLPIRIDWASKRKWKTPLVVYGHQAYDKVRVINNTIGIDTGAGHGGKLSALKYPEIEIFQVDQKYFKFIK